jgi:hypothetical protein
MNSLALQSYAYGESRIFGFFRTAYQGSRLLCLHAAVMLVCFGVCLALQNFDIRQFNGANVWMKPGKFFLSFVVQFLTVAWAMSLIPVNSRENRTIRWANWALIAAAWFELLYIVFRAARGEASHFNVATPLNAALYSMMAGASVVLVAAPAIVGWKIWRAKPQDLWTTSVVIGFLVAALCTMVVGFTLGGNSSHWIGGDLTDATGLPIFKWSTTGGDLRVAHFIGLHAMQFVPMAALSGKRSVVFAVAIIVTIATALTYVQAISGVPLLRP